MFAFSRVLPPTEWRKNPKAEVGCVKFAKRFSWCSAAVCGDEPHFSRSACAVLMDRFFRGTGWSGALRGEGLE